VADVKAEIRGLKETQDKMEQMVRDLHGDAMLTGMRNATMLVYRDAVKNAPVDTGRLRASITPAVRVEGTTVVGVVGSNVLYAPFMEHGTGIYAGRGRHWPPSSALEVWARRHGFTSGFQVARIIGLRGGLRALKYLQRAIESNAERIFNLLGGVVAKIVSK